jgi:hypothetical protein
MHTAIDAALHSRIGPLSQRVFDPIDLSPAACRCLQPVAVGGHLVFCAVSRVGVAPQSSCFLVPKFLPSLVRPRVFYNFWCRLPRGFDSDWEGGEQMSAMVSMRGLLPRDLMPVGGVPVTRDTVNHWLLDSMCCDGYHVPRSYNSLQPLCVPAAFPRRLLPGALQHARRRTRTLTPAFTCCRPWSAPPSPPHVTRVVQRQAPELLLDALHAPAAAALPRRGYGRTAGC